MRGVTLAGCLSTLIILAGIAIGAGGCVVNFHEASEIGGGLVEQLHVCSGLVLFGFCAWGVLCLVGPTMEAWTETREGGTE